MSAAASFVSPVPGTTSSSNLRLALTTLPHQAHTRLAESARSGNLKRNYAHGREMGLWDCGG
eukprot:3759917-Rhodomonas_salina.1